MKTSAYSFHSSDWSSILAANGFSDTVLSSLIDGLYKDETIWKKHISKSLIHLILAEYNFELPTIVNELSSEDGTVKFQMRMRDGMEVETVLIPFYKRFTVCLSTQVGCAMNCSFCYTGTQGLKRHLTAGEIVGQYLVARTWLRTRNSKAINPRIVFMGQGEPLHNADEVLKSLKVFTDRNIICLGPKEMTLSTVGYLPGLSKIMQVPGINIALSLHSPFQAQRTELIPLSAKYELSEVMDAMDKLPLNDKRIITYEYLLIKDYNMSDEHVEGLHKLLSHRRAVVNLIPFNPFPGSSWQRPDKEEIEIFREKLVSRKLRVMVRATKGHEILAACGQLKIERLARNYGKS